MARATATAPTITSLLTSGASAIPNQPAVILKSSNDPDFMTRPISGPPVAEVANTEPSPSQAAPTLSMLLEKNKLATGASATTSKPNESPTKSADAEASSSDKQAAADLEAIFTDDPVEQHLIEAFCKNIIDDIGIEIVSVIDEEILKNVDNVVSPAEEPANAEVADFDDKLESLNHNDSASCKSSQSPAQPKTQEVVIGSSDDSNDNIPLAAVASQESKDRSQPSVEAADIATDDAEIIAEELNETITIASSSSEENAREVPTPVVADTVEASETVVSKSPGAIEANTPEASKKTEESAPSEETEVKTEQVEATNEG